MSPSVFPLVERTHCFCCHD